MAITVKTDIENAIRTIMLADSEFNRLKAIFRGVPLKVPLQFYPYAEIVITNWVNHDLLTGGFQVREYRGQARFWDKAQDMPEVVARAANVDSYVVIQELVDAFVYRFTLSANKTLGGLTFSGTPQGHVQAFEPFGGLYGYEDRETKPNNIDNFGIVDFSCRTLERMV